jgi:inosine/xanthosine triphosphate pyrophosphatase family protein
MKIAIVTSNGQKFSEYQASLSRHAVKVHRAEGEPAALLSEADLVLREESNLVEPGTRRVLGSGQERLGRVADNLTVLTVHRRDHLPRTFEARVAGYLDPRRRQGEGVFGWDDIFVMASTQMTYHEMRALGLKRSARDQVLAGFAQEFLWFEQPVELAWGELAAERAVDFGLDAERFLMEHPFYGRTFGNDGFRGVDRIVRRVLAQGLFFRAARNRRERNYWLPGLNAGVPLTPKRDAFHEATFMMHDLMHFAFPDLLPDERRDEGARKVYLTWRMMSEAFTLVLADMIFVDGWRAEGFPYDYGARRLHPIWATGRWNGVEEALTAAARWMLRADVSGWQRAGVEAAVIERLREKYDQYARSDWRWTGRNWQNLCQRRWPTARWLELARAVAAKFGLDLLTVGEVAGELKAEGVPLSDGTAVFEGVLGRYLDRYRRLCAPVAEGVADGRSQGFRRWLLGQMALFERYGFFGASAAYEEILRTQLLETQTWDEERILGARQLLEQYLGQLLRHDIITEEERRIWAEVYPLFEPFYVGYDTQSGEPLGQVIDEVLAAPV